MKTINFINAISSVLLISELYFLCYFVGKIADIDKWNKIKRIEIKNAVIPNFRLGTLILAIKLWKRYVLLNLHYLRDELAMGTEIWQFLLQKYEFLHSKCKMNRNMEIGSYEVLVSIKCDKFHLKGFGIERRFYSNYITALNNEKNLRPIEKKREFDHYGV